MINRQTKAAAFNFGRELTPESEPTSLEILVERLGEISKRLRKSEIWSDRKQRDQITKLLAELDKLTANDHRDIAVSFVPLAMMDVLKLGDELESILIHATQPPYNARYPSRD